MNRRAKIVGTLGPATDDDASLRRLLDAGLDVVRLNLSHGTRSGHQQAIARVRRIAAEACRHIPVILDLMGPRYRLGAMAGVSVLEAGSIVHLGTSDQNVDLAIDDPALLAALQSGERILIDNGLVELRVTEKAENRITATVEIGGPVSSRKGINLPDSDLPFSVSNKDRSDIEFAVEADADYLAASYVGSASDLEAVRQTVTDAGGQIPIIAKLERSRAVDNLDSLVAAADAVMVARGDLGVEVPLHDVPILQKRIVASGRCHGKPVIVATQMLESMMERTRPTRAESSDVANAVFDGADALMLSGESAVGHHPVRAVQTMARIICAAEDYIGDASAPERPFGRLSSGDAPEADASNESAGSTVTAFEIADTIAASAVYAAQTLGLRHIVAFSQGGFTARVISRYRPHAPIWMLTTLDSVARRVQLAWGVRPLLLSEDVEHHDEIIDRVDRELLRHGIAETGDAIAVLMGDPIRERPLTNLLRIHRIRGRGREQEA